MGVFRTKLMAVDSMIRSHKIVDARKALIEHQHEDLGMQSVVAKLQNDLKEYDGAIREILYNLSGEGDNPRNDEGAGALALLFDLLKDIEKNIKTLKQSQFRLR